MGAYRAKGSSQHSVLYITSAYDRASKSVLLVLRLRGSTEFEPRRESAAPFVYVPTVCIKPEAVNRLFHRPVVCFKPDAATGEEQFSGNNATSSVARTVAEVIFRVRLSEVLVLQQCKREYVVPDLGGQDAEER